ncbi:MAG: hypothetical protein KF812_08575 [Fimbriimonadaceae bacterium]|nr:hypothetical protein [Fimbriimonadaceae bacterium]
MKTWLWIATGLTVTAGVAMTRAPESQQTDPTPPRERTLAFPAPLERSINYMLDNSVKALEDPASLDEDRFGFSRIPVFRVGDHHVPLSGKVLWLYGNNTAKFDPATWESQTIGYSSQEVPSEAETRAFDRKAKEAIGYFKDGWRQPIRWTAADGYFEARQVRLSDVKCVECHQGNKQGDIVGVVMLGLSREAGQRIINAAATGP